MIHICAAQLFFGGNSCEPSCHEELYIGMQKSTLLSAVVLQGMQIHSPLCAVLGQLAERRAV